MANSGGVRGLILYKFKSGPAANQSDQVTTVDDIYLYYSSVSNQFHWFAQDTASALDGNMYSWSPSTYGNGNATPNQWVTNAQPIGQIRNFKHRGNNPSGSVNGYSGETYNVQIRTINGSPDISDWVDSTVNSIAYLPRQNWMVYNYSDTAGANCVGAIFNLQGNTRHKSQRRRQLPIWRPQHQQPHAHRPAHASPGCRSKCRGRFLAARCQHLPGYQRVRPKRQPQCR
ncbi:MAG: hypothetical protein R2857_00155 [Vampirovibrionales bacterium]